MKKGLCLFAILIIFNHHLWGDPIDSATAKVVASHFFKYKQKTLSSIKLVHAEQTLGAYFVFESDENFVIVSGDDAAYPILGYSLTSSFGEEPLPPALKSLLASYTNQIAIIRNQKVEATQEIQEAWQTWLHGQVPSTEKNSVGPLLYCLWDQGRYYNALCPEDPNGPGGRVYAGCVATMMGMIMYYYRYPTQPTGTHGYYSPYGWLSVNFNQRQYNYNEMPYQLKGDNLQVATLLYDCGVSVNMHYSPEGSGAYMEDATNAFKTYFGYNSSLYLDYKDNYSESNWINKLKTELNAYRPIPYAGFGSEGGHAFVCDGYDDLNLFHFNWGWNGYYNGYYYINNLNPGTNFSSGQQAIFGVYPSSPSYQPQSCANYTMHEKSGSLQVGFPFSSYGNNLQCSWYINPSDTVTNIKLLPGYFFTENNYDVLNIYAGSDASGQLIGSYSGTSIPSSIVVPGQRAFITFHSNSSVTDKGFHIDYYCTEPIFCTVNNVLTDPEGFITDGSGTYNYQNNTTCRWILKPQNASGIFIEVIKLELESPNDVLNIYSYPNNLFLESLSGSIYNQTFYFPYSQIQLVFKSDDSNTRQGFLLKYSTSPVYIQDSQNAFIFSANVIFRTLYVTIQNLIEGKYNLKVFTSHGQLVLDETFLVNSGSSTFSFPFSFSPGIYTINLQNEYIYFYQKIFVKE